MVFGPDAVSEKLANLKPTLDSIRSVAGWMLFHHRSAPVIVKRWDEDFRLAPASRKLTFLHLMNEILQSREPTKQPFEDLFGDIIVSAFAHALSNTRDAKEKHKIARIAHVLKDRKVLSTELMQEVSIEVDLAGESAPSSQSGESDYATSDDSDDDLFSDADTDEREDGPISTAAGSSPRSPRRQRPKTVAVPTVKFSSEIQKLFDYLRDVKRLEATSSSYITEIASLHQDVQEYAAYVAKSSGGANNADAKTSSTNAEEDKSTPSEQQQTSGGDSETDNVEYDEVPKKLVFSEARDLIRRYKQHIAQKEVRLACLLPACCCLLMLRNCSLCRACVWHVACVTVVMCVAPVDGAPLN
mgnify:CR=1 FL=1